MGILKNLQLQQTGTTPQGGGILQRLRAQQAAREEEKRNSYKKNGTVKNLAIGVGKGELSTVKGLGTVGQTILDQTAGRAVNAALGRGFTAKPVSSSNDVFRKGTETEKRVGEALIPQGAAQNIGFAGEKVGEFMVGGGAVSKATTGMKILPRILTRTAGDVAISQAQTGGDLKTAAATGVPSAVGNALFPGAGVAGSALGTIFKSTATGYTSDVASGMAGFRGEERTGSKAFIPGAGTALGAAFGTAMAAPQIAQNAKTLTKPFSPTQTMERVIGLNKSDYQKFNQITGKRVGTYLNEIGAYGNIDDISQKLSQRATQSMNKVDDGLAQIQGKYKPKEAVDMLTDLVAREQKLGVAGKDTATIETLARNFAADGLDMSEINQLKRLYEKNIKFGYNKAINPDTVERATRVDNALRNWQFKEATNRGFEDLGKLNKETQAAKQLLNAIGKKYAGDANQLIGLGDLVLLSGGDPSAISMFLARKAFLNKKVQSSIAKTLYRGGEKPLPSGSVDEIKASIKMLPAPKDTTFRSSVGSGPVQNLPEDIQKYNLGTEGMENARIVNPNDRRKLIQGFTTKTTPLPQTKKDLSTKASQIKATTNKNPAITKSASNLIDLTIPQNKKKGIPNKKGGFLGVGAANKDVKSALGKFIPNKTALSELRTKVDKAVNQLNKLEPGTSAYAGKLKSVKALQGQYAEMLQRYKTRKGGFAKVPFLGKKEVASDLAQEAKKYKSAEEFVSGQGTPVYHGTAMDVKDIEPQLGIMSRSLGIKEKAIYLTPDKKTAQKYATNAGYKTIGEETKNVGGRVEELFVKPDAKIKIFNTKRTTGELGAEISKAKLEGYDGIRYPESGTDTYAIFNKEVLKTRSQLANIWNKAKQQTLNKSNQ